LIIHEFVLPKKQNDIFGYDGDDVITDFHHYCGNYPLLIQDHDHSYLSTVQNPAKYIFFVTYDEFLHRRLFLYRNQNRIDLYDDDMLSKNEKELLKGNSNQLKNCFLHFQVFHLV